MKYEILDQNIPEDDPEILQVLFAHTDESVDSQVYVLTITYSIHYESVAGDPFTWDSDWDYYGYEECDVEFIYFDIRKHDPENDSRYLYGTGESVDDIGLDDVLSSEDFKAFKKSIEENYCKYVQDIREDW